MTTAARISPVGVRIAVVALVATLALAFRIDAARRAGGVWRDEANDIFLCRNHQTLGAVLQATGAEGSPPLRFLVECTVERWSAGSILWSRGVVITFGTLAVALVTHVSARAFGPLAGLIAGTLGATSPFLIRFSVELRGYAQYQLTAALYALAIVAFLERRTTRLAVAAGVASAALLLTHYGGIFLIAAATLWLAAIEARSRRETMLVALSLAVLAVLVAPAVPAFLQQAAGDLRGWFVPNRKGADLVRVASLALGHWGTAIAAPLLAWYAWRTRHDRPASWNVLLAGAIGGNVLAWLAQFVPPFRARLEPWYLAGMVVWLLPAVGAALAAFAPSAPGRGAERTRPRIAALAAGVALILTSQLADAGNWLEPRSPVPQIAEIVEREGRPGDLIVIVPAAHASTFNFYYRGALDQWAPPLRGRITHVPWRELAQALERASEREAVTAAVATRLRTGGRVWLIAGGPPVDREREDDPVEAPTAYARANLTIRREVVRALFANGEPVRFAAIPKAEYWEAADLLLFTYRK